MLVSCASVGDLGGCPKATSIQFAMIQHDLDQLALFYIYIVLEHVYDRGYSFNLIAHRFRALIICLELFFQSEFLQIQNIVALINNQ